jgi:succinate dehydrogenase / fumarate reductase membrane anchor subunit
MSLKTPLGRVLGLGSAKEGTDHWWAQRVSAVALIILGSWFVFSVLRLESLTYLDVIRFIGVPLNAVLLSLLSLTLAYHSYLGVQVVIEDTVMTSSSSAPAAQGCARHSGWHRPASTRRASPRYFRRAATP